MSLILRYFITLLLYLVSLQSEADTQSANLLPSKEAFQFNSQVKEGNRLLLSWDIANGYYLYLKKFKFSSLTPGIMISNSVFPPSEIKKSHVGVVEEVYRNHVDIEIQLQKQSSNIDNLNLEIIYQGCADKGVCYMPDKKALLLNLAHHSFNDWRLSYYTAELASFRRIY